MSLIILISGLDTVHLLLYIYTEKVGQIILLKKKLRKAESLKSEDRHNAVCATVLLKITQNSAKKQNKTKHIFN